MLDNRKACMCSSLNIREVQAYFLLICAASIMGNGANWAWLAVLCFAVPLLGELP